MKKKLLTLAIAAVMVVSSAMSSFAATVADVNASGWWVAHSEGIEVNETGVKISFTTKTTGTANWNTPNYVIYTADKKFAGTNSETGVGTVNTVEGYVELAVCRADVYAWSVLGNANNGCVVTGQNDQGADLYDANTNYGTGTEPSNAYKNWETLGYTWKGTPLADNTAWAAWLDTAKAGTMTGTIEAKITNGVATVKFTVGDAVSEATYPVAAGKTLYISLGGDSCTVSNISYEAMPTAQAPSTGNQEQTPVVPPTGDATMVGLLLAVAAVSAVIVLKKKTVTE